MLTDVNAVMHNPDESITLSSTSFHKDNLHSNTVFAIYKVENDELVSTIEIHTSCSQDLYIGQTVSDNGYTLEITDGLKDGETSISASNPQTCGDEPEPEKTGTIVVRNALTVDNGDQATFADFSYKVMDELGTEFPLTPDALDPSIHVAEVPKGPYVLTQSIADEISETYTEVLITGDKKCPATTNGSFMIKKDKTVSCTIYNDDNGDGSSGEPGAGVVFRPTSVTFNLGTMISYDIPDESETVTIDSSPDTILVIDPEFQDADAENLIVVFTLVDTTKSGNPIQCFSEGIVEDAGINGFRIICPEGLDTEIQYALNYALIKTIVLTAVP